MIRNRAENAAQWEPDKLIAILIRQFKRLIHERGVELTENEILRVAGLAAQRQADDAVLQQIASAMIPVIEDSLATLAGWSLTYAQSLATSMDAMPGWETTADFLEIANEKGNAELKISAGSSLLAYLGNARFADLLMACYQHGKEDPEDVDAVLARRALCFTFNIDEHAADWLDQVRARMPNVDLSSQ